MAAKIDRYQTSLSSESAVQGLQCKSSQMKNGANL